MKHNYFLLLIIIAIVLLSNTKGIAQIGIGTTHPTKDLDINGELRIRNLPSTSINTEVLTADADGNIQKFKVFLISDIGFVEATTNVDYTHNAYSIIDDIDLGLSTTVVIPANAEALVNIFYSVPMGVLYTSTTRGYYGIRFLKDGIEAPQGSRKFAVNQSSGTDNVVSVANTYTENFAASSVDRTITYTLNGYIEQNQSGARDYRFNMFSTGAPNENWGRAILTKVVYIK